MGNLARQSWDEIINSEVAQRTRQKVAACDQNCWMVTTARTAMRSNIVPQMPKAEPLLWVLKNKLKVSIGKKICFDSYINYSDVRPSPIVKRESYPGKEQSKHDWSRGVKPRTSTIR